jgi:hypothetical protein
MGGHDGVDATYSFTSIVVHEVVVLRDRMSVHNCCSVCITNEVDGNVSVCRCI